jgi:hypothetical protein
MMMFQEGCLRKKERKKEREREEEGRKEDNER